MAAEGDGARLLRHERSGGRQGLLPLWPLVRGCREHVRHARVAHGHTSAASRIELDVASLRMRSRRPPRSSRPPDIASSARRDGGVEADDRPTAKPRRTAGRHLVHALDARPRGQRNKSTNWIAGLPTEAEVQRRAAEIRTRMVDGRSTFIGEFDPEPISLTDASAAWPEQYARLRDRLAAALGGGVRIEHVGSTSIPGIAAKPIIDIQVSVPDLADESEFVPRDRVGRRPACGCASRIWGTSTFAMRSRARSISTFARSAANGSETTSCFAITCERIREAARAYEDMKRAAVEAYRERPDRVHGGEGSVHRARTRQPRRSGRSKPAGRPSDPSPGRVR